MTRLFSLLALGIIVMVGGTSIVGAQSMPDLKGTWTACHAAAKHMKSRGFGRIVIVSSTAGQRGEANVSNYAASKGGQIAFTKSLTR